MAHFNLREIRLSDARDLSEWIGPFAPDEARGKNGKHSYTGMRSYLRKLLRFTPFQAFVWEKDNDDLFHHAGQEFLIQGDNEDEVTSLALVFCSPTVLRTGTVQVEVLLPPNHKKLDIHEEQLLESIFRKLGANPAVKVMNLYIPQEYKSLSEACNHSVPELLSTKYPLGRSTSDDKEEWMEIFSFSKSTNWPLTWAFVPTPFGLFAVYGDENSISTVEWLDYESFIEDIAIRELCIVDGFADNFGMLKEREECEVAFQKQLSRIDESNGASGKKSSTTIKKRLIPSMLLQAQHELKEYFAGERSRFDVQLVNSEGTRFQRAVWQEIAKIPYGATASYEDIGIHVAGGDPVTGRNYTRAVGAACGANPLAIFVPCHRIIAKDGKLQGYAYGVERKDWLLSLEILGAAEYEQSL